MIAESSIQDLLVLLNFLFGRMQLYIPSYQTRKDTFTNSKVTISTMPVQDMIFTIVLPRCYCRPCCPSSSPASSSSTS